MSVPKVTAVAEASPAALAGIRVGDEIVSLNGRQPRDVIEYQQLVDADRLEVVVRRPDAPLARALRIDKEAGQPLGLEVAAAIFDRVRTCDNHCAFCFIYQLPKGMRRSLYLKDDDYRLSFLYGNFTTLTRFTELDAERVIEERLSPLFVSIHATDPEVRAAMLRNPRGATSLRWLRVLLDAGIEVHGQVVVCPGVNDGPVLDDTLRGVLDQYPKLATVGLVPLGVSRSSAEPTMRSHTVEEAAAVCDAVARWQEVFGSVLGRRLVHAADEYYLLASRPFPPAPTYDGYPQHENGIGMARAFEAGFAGSSDVPSGVRHGFFSWVDGAPSIGYRAPRAGGGGHAPAPSGDVGHLGDDRPITVVTGAYGAMVLAPLLDAHPRADVELLAVENTFFGGNIGVTGLLTGADVGSALMGRPTGRRYLLPDVCLSEGRFLDGTTVEQLPVPVEVLPTEGWALRAALDGRAVARPGSPTAPSLPLSLARCGP
jgi:putative radical SAM enzyme (TIGR03279 family)